MGIKITEEIVPTPKHLFCKKHKIGIRVNWNWPVFYCEECKKVRLGESEMYCDLKDVSVKEEMENHLKKYRGK